MIRLSVAIVICLACLACLGCASSQMTLKRVGQDIPSALVSKYNTNASPYVDEAETYCLPLLFISKGHVAKTVNGFQAYEDGSLGFGILIATAEYADFDEKGQLLKQEAKGSLLTGLLLSERVSRVRQGTELKTGHAWSMLWGAIGFEKDPNGAKRLSVLWIPIPISRGDKT